LVKSSTALFFLILSIGEAKEILSIGSAYFPDTISKTEACGQAFIDAQKKAMSEAGLERGRFLDIEICSENKEGASCNLVQESQSYFDGGFITSSKITKQYEVGSSINRTCVIEAVFDVRKFDQQHDPDFAFNAELSKTRIFENDTIFVTGETNQPAYIQLVWFDPKTNIFTKVFPNKYEKTSQIVGKFTIPSKEGKKKYQFYGQFLPDFMGNQVAEFLLVLATTKQFPLLEREEAPSFYSRLNDLGRSNWRKINLGYTVYRN